MDYLDIVDRLVEEGAYPSSLRIRKEFPYTVSPQLLAHAKLELIETGEIANARTGKHHKSIDPNYLDFAEEYQRLHEDMESEGVSPTLERMRLRFSCSVNQETLSEVRKHLVEQGEITMGRQFQMEPHDDPKEVKTLTVMERLASIAALMDGTRPRRIFARPTDKYIHQFRCAWKRIRRAPRGVSGGPPAHTYIGIEPTARGTFVARYWTPQGRVWIGTYDTAEEAARARDETIILKGLRHKLNFPNERRRALAAAQ